MVKLVIEGKIVEMEEDELRRRFSPNTFGGVGDFEILDALSEKPKQLPSIMKDMKLNESANPKRHYSRIRYHLVKLSEKGLVGKHKVNAKTVLWYLTEKGLKKLEKR